MKSFRSFLIGPGLLTCSFIFHTGLLAQEAPDSIVQLTAEAQGLEPIAPESLPPFGTFWVVGSNGCAAPYPCLPKDSDSIFPIYAMAEGQYLVDGTDGQVSLNPRQTNATVAAALTAQAATVVALIEQVQTPTIQRRAQTMTLAGGPTPPGAGTGGTNVYYPNGNSYTPPDYGTNLYIAQVSITNGWLAGVASNTLADVPYGLLTNGDLTTTNWVATGRVFYGAAATNWTAFTALPVSRTNNLFFRLRSEASSDGSGLPDWWEAAYGVSDPYGDPDGDGWNNYQEMLRGTNPNQFDPPPAPQGVTVSYNANNHTATLNWLPSPGPVTGYIITDSNGHAFTVSATTTTFAGSVTNLPDLEQGGNIPVSYTVQASYAGGNSAASALVPLEAANFSGVIAPGPAGVAELLVSALPAGTAALRLTQIGYFYVAGGESATLITNFAVPLSHFTNGVCILPNIQVAGVGQYYDENYAWFGQAVDSNGHVGANLYLGGVFVDAANGNYQTNWLVPPFYDGRAQLKQNLVFQLRAAGVYAPFQYYASSNGVYAGYFTGPAGYACAGFYDARIYGNNSDYYSQTLNPLRPFLDNALDRNFVFTSADVDEAGRLATGANLNVETFLDEPAQYQFQGDQTALLAANDSRWLLYDALNEGGVVNAGLISVVSDGASYCTLSLTNHARNWFGLPYVSANVAYARYDGSFNYLGVATNIISAGSAATFSGNDFFTVYGNESAIYPETAQPQFQTVAYDFWRPAPVYHVSLPPDIDSLPGNPYFAPTNAGASFILAGVGSSMTLAAYAKLAVTNGYLGVYGYLGQYFDQAYKLDTNGMVTANPTGVLSPYGSFFATEPGPAALVTMPDLDTGERGTGIVHCVTLQVDKNHDGEMDSAFNGPDATSPASPMVCWVNNGQTVAGTSGGLDKDLPVPSNHPEQANYAQGKITCPRDLENLFRLWIRGVPQLPAAQGYTVTFSLTALSGAPAINLYLSSDPQGGTGYLTDTNAAAEQARTEMSPNPEFGLALATVNAQQSYTLPPDFFDYHYPYYSRFLFEGAGIGEGQLTLTIAQNGNTLAQTSVYLDIHDIKDLYEQAHITNVATTYPAMVNSTNASGYALDHQLPLNPAETNQMIVFVHGWRMTQFDYQSFSDSMFKRLYWAGYQGRFAALRWPTLSTDTTGDISQYFTYNRSEHIAFDSAAGASAYFDSLKARFPGYSINVAAHSMGNIVMMETLKQQLAEGSHAIDNYVLMQAAVPAQCYDTSLANYSVFTTAEASHPTPDVYRGYPGAISDALNGQMINFFNTNDYALATGVKYGVQANWEANQVNNKPDLYWSYYYDGTIATCLYGNSRVVTDPHELMPFVSRPRSKAVGALGGVNGVIRGSEVDLTGGFNFRGDSTEHSAQFNWSIQRLGPFYTELLANLFPQNP